MNLYFITLYKYKGLFTLRTHLHSRWVIIQYSTGNTSYRVFGKYCPIPLFSQFFSLVSNRDERDSCSNRICCTSVQFNVYTVTRLWLVYYISRQTVLNLRIGQYFPNTLYYIHINLCYKNILFEGGGGDFMS